MFQRILTDDEVKILEYSLLDINAWINGMIDGKINNSLTRAVREYRDLLVKRDSPTIPVSEKAAFDAYSKDPEYRDRKQREPIIVINPVPKK